MLPDPGMLVVSQSLAIQPDRQFRSHFDLMAENNGFIPWCGPAALALASGLSYRDTGERLRQTAPDRYPQQGEIVTAYWRDILWVLAQDEVSYLTVPVTGGRLCDMLRSLASGWYLARVTDHFLLLRQSQGRATFHDNWNSGTRVSPCNFGLHEVTHLAHLLDGPRPSREVSSHAGY